MRKGGGRASVTAIGVMRYGEWNREWTEPFGRGAGGGLGKGRDQMNANSREGSGSEILILASIGVIRGYTLFPFAVEGPEKSQKAGRSEFLPLFVPLAPLRGHSKSAPVCSDFVGPGWISLDLGPFPPPPRHRRSNALQRPCAARRRLSPLRRGSRDCARLRDKASAVTHSPIHPFTHSPVIRPFSSGESPAPAIAAEFGWP